MSEPREKTSFAVLDATFIGHAKTVEGLPPPMLAEVAFAGKSNVGKSSLINKLVNRRKLVRTSSTPGATRGLSLFRVRLRLEGGAGAELDLVDLPGYGFAQRSKDERRSWGPMIEGYLERRVSLRAVLLLVDVRRGVAEEDAQLLAYLAHLERPAILVVTKCDKVSRRERDASLRAITRDARAAYPTLPIVATSAESGEGIPELWKATRRATFLEGAAPPAHGMNQLP